MPTLVSHHPSHRNPADRTSSSVSLGLSSSVLLPDLLLIVFLAIIPAGMRLPAGHVIGTHRLLPLLFILLQLRATIQYL